MKYENSVQAVSCSWNFVLEEEEIEFLDLRFSLLNTMEDFVGRQVTEPDILRPIIEIIASESHNELEA